MKVTVTKSLAHAEHVIVEIQGSAKQIAEELPFAYKVVDDRLLAMNKRVLAFNPLFQRLAKEHPKAAMLVHDLLREITGQKVMTDDQYGVMAAQLEEAHYDQVVDQAKAGAAA